MRNFPDELLHFGEKALSGGSDDNSSYADIGSPSETVTAAQGVLGKEVQIMIPEGFAKKYLRVNAVVTGTFSAGKFDAWVDTYLGI